MIFLCTLYLHYRLPSRQWMNAIATLVTSEIIELKYTIDNETYKEMVEVESDRIMPCNTMVGNLRREVATKIDSMLK